MYFDGHERPDVVAARIKYVQEIEDADAVQEEIVDDYQCDDDAVQADLEEGLDREGILDVDADEADDNVLFDVYRWVETLT